MTEYPSQPHTPEPHSASSQPPEIGVPPWAQPKRNTGGLAPSNPASQQWAWQDATPPPPPVSQPVALQQQAPLPPIQRQRSGTSTLGTLALLVLAFGIGAVLGAKFIPVLLHSTTGTGTIPTTTPTAVPLAQIMYSVTAISGSTIVAIRPNGTPLLIHTDSATTYQRDGLPAAFNDIRAGIRVTVRGKIQSDGSILAGRISMLDPSILGTIKAINASALTLTARNGASINVSLNSNTKIVDAKTHQLANLSSLKVGQKVEAFGELRGSGTLGALVVKVQQ